MGPFIFTNQNVSFVDEHAVFRKQCYSIQALISPARPQPPQRDITACSQAKLNMNKRESNMFFIVSSRFE